MDKFTSAVDGESSFLFIGLWFFFLFYIPTEHQYNQSNGKRIYKEKTQERKKQKWKEKCTHEIVHNPRLVTLTKWFSALYIYLSSSVSLNTITLAKQIKYIRYFVICYCLNDFFFSFLLFFRCELKLKQCVPRPMRNVKEWTSTVIIIIIHRDYISQRVKWVSFSFNISFSRVEAMICELRNEKIKTKRVMNMTSMNQ